MRSALISIFTFVFISSYSQTGTIKIFKRTEYINGNFYRSIFDTIKVPNDNIDIYFFKKHFYTPYYLPDKFFDKRYKNQKISVWANPKGEKNYKKNWEDIFTYDSLSRVTQFTYSGCLICNSLSYDYSVIYNSKGQVCQITNSITEQDSFKFYYNTKGEIEKFEKYFFGKLATEIKLLE